MHKSVQITSYGANLKMRLRGGIQPTENIKYDSKKLTDKDIRQKNEDERHRSQTYKEKYKLQPTTQSSQEAKKTNGYQMKR